MQPLAIASYWGHVSCVECLLRHGADVHGDQDSSLRCAADQGHDLVVDLLLRAGADVHAKSDMALLTAVYNGHIATVKRLLQAGADVTVYGQDAICYAAGRPNTEELRCVLDALGDVPLNSSALTTAIDSSLPDNLQLLLDRGADPMEQGGRPLWTVGSSRNSKSPALVTMVDMLVKAGADVHAGHDRALRRAIEQGHTDVVQRLVYHGARLQAVLDDPGATLTTVAAKGDVPMIELLLNAGTSLESAAASELLHQAAEHKRTGVIDLFEARGASPVSINEARLMAAASHGDLQQMGEILSRQQPPFELHLRPLRVAVQRRHEHVVAALLEHGKYVGPVPEMTCRLLRYFMITAARFGGSLGIFRLLVDHIVFDRAELIEVLHHLLTASDDCKSAVTLLLDRYAGSVLSVVDLTQLSARLVHHERGLALLHPYIARISSST